MVRLAEYSRDKPIELRSAAGIRYDDRQGGTRQLLRKQEQLDGVGKDAGVLRPDGVPFEVLDVEGCIRAEPPLGAVRDKFVGGLRLPGDGSGDCFKFMNALATMACGSGRVLAHDRRARRRRGPSGGCAHGHGYGSAGERCMAISVPVGERTADALMERLAPRVRALKIGPGTDPNAEIASRATTRRRGWSASTSSATAPPCSSGTATRGASPRTGSRWAWWESTCPSPCR